MTENWLERTDRMLVQMHCTAEEKLECATSLLQDEAYQDRTIRESYVTPQKCTLVVFDMFRVFCKRNLNVS